MTRILVHAGFHKTGTTALQSFLNANRAALGDRAAIYLGRRLGAARKLGRVYGELPVPWRRLAFRRALDAFVSDLPDAPLIVISRESFSGAMLGASRMGRPVTSYLPVAARLAQDIVAALRARFGDAAEVEFLYTTRNTPGLLRSVWGHQLRTKALADDFETFAAPFAAMPGLAAQAQRIAALLAPVRVHIAPLEDVADHRLSHGVTLLRLLGVPEADWSAFAPPTDTYAGPSPSLCEAFLKMNRARPVPADLRARKEALWRAEIEAGAAAAVCDWNSPATWR